MKKAKINRKRWSGRSGVKSGRAGETDLENKTTKLRRFSPSEAEYQSCKRCFQHTYSLRMTCQDKQSRRNQSHGEKQRLRSSALPNGQQILSTRVAPTINCVINILQLNSAIPAERWKSKTSRAGVRTATRYPFRGNGRSSSSALLTGFVPDPAGKLNNLTYLLLF